MKKIPPSERIRKGIAELLERGTTEDLLGRLLHEGARLVAQEMLEGEATDFLERGHYKRCAEGEFRGYRNGYEPRRIKTAEGTLEVELPQVRDTAEPFVSKLKVFLRGNTECLERLAAEMYARGLSVRDIEDALIEGTGDMVLSKSCVSKVTDILWEDYERFRQRDLSEFEIEYLFLDAVYESVRKLAGIKEALLAAWGIQRDGRKVLLSLGLGNKESYDSWLEFLRDMVGRGLRVPVSINSDGSKGAIKAIEVMFSEIVAPQVLGAPDEESLRESAAGTVAGTQGRDRRGQGCIELQAGEETGRELHRETQEDLSLTGFLLF